MTSALAITVPQATQGYVGSACTEQEIDDKFHRLLEADRNSAEFAELWAAVDAYVSSELAKERQR